MKNVLMAFWSLRWFTVPLLIGAIVGGLLQLYWFPAVAGRKSLVLGLLFLAVLLAWIVWGLLANAKQKRDVRTLQAQELKAAAIRKYPTLREGDAIARFQSEGGLRE